MAVAMAVAMAMAMAMAMATAMAVIRPEHAYRGRPPRKSTFYEKQCFSLILVISGPSRPQKWIRLEILRWKMVPRGLETSN